MPMPLPITGVFNQATRSTTYTANYTGPNLHYSWSVSIPLDPNCAAGFRPNNPQPNQAFWFHADVSQGGPCNHAGNAYGEAGSGHPGTITLVVTNDNWTCVATIFGTQGPQAQPMFAGPQPPPCQVKQ